MKEEAKGEMCIVRKVIVEAVRGEGGGKQTAAPWVGVGVRDAGEDNECVKEVFLCLDPVRQDVASRNGITLLKVVKRVELGFRESWHIAALDFACSASVIAR